MLALPPVDPPRWWRFATRISRDHYIRVDTCDYSVHPLAIGKKVQVRTDTDEVIVILTPGGAEVARHPRCWAKQQTITDPVHARAAALLRGDYRHHQASRARAARQAGAATAADLVEVEQRQLDSYDRMFTLIEGGGGTRRAGGLLMPPTATKASPGKPQTGRQTASDLSFLTRAMKAPALLDAAERLVERALSFPPVNSMARTGLG